MKTYPTRTRVLGLGKWGRVPFTEWLYIENPPLITEEYVDQVAAHIPKGSLAIDIGAFIGDTTVPMALAVGREGLVIAFEPGPAAWPFLLGNLAQGGFGQVVAYPNAITSVAGRYTFHYTDEGFINGGFSLATDAGPGGCGNPIAHEVEGVDLTERLMAGYKERLPKLSFVKIDTEGYDKEIVKANMELLKRYRPVLQVEVYPFLSERERLELMQAIKEAGYGWEGGAKAFTAQSPQPSDVICKPL